MSKGATRVVVAGLIGGVLVATLKFAASIISGSNAMFTEALHSTVDLSNQILLLVGQRRGKAKADDSHQFGYGLETYFWAFVVAVFVLLFGAGAAIYEGYAHLVAHAPVVSPWVSLGVLGFSMVFEGGSFIVGFREYKRRVRGHDVEGQPVGFWRFIGLTKDPSLYASLLSDVAGLIGIVIAACGVVASAVLGVTWADGAASLAIGALLVVEAVIIMGATRGLIGGESVVQPVCHAIAKVLAAEPTLQTPAKVATLHLGPDSILVALTLNLPKTMKVAEIEVLISDITVKLKVVDDRINYVFVDFP